MSDFLTRLEGLSVLDAAPIPILLLMVAYAFLSGGGTKH